MASKRPNPVSRRPAFWLAVLAASGLAACMESAPSAIGPDNGQAAEGAQTLAQKPASRPGVPEGCMLEWSKAKRDSVLYCPDVAPPSIR